MLMVFCLRRSLVASYEQKSAGDPVSLANLLWAAALTPLPTVEVLLAAHEEVLWQAEGVELVRLLWALGPKPPFPCDLLTFPLFCLSFSSFFERFFMAFMRFHGVAAGSLRVEHRVFERCLEVEASKSQDVANVVWALSRVGRAIPERLLAALESCEELPAAELVASLGALAEARNATSALWAASGRRQWPERALSAVLCAHATAQVALPEPLREALPRVAGFSAPAVAKSLWASAKLQLEIPTEALRRSQELLKSFKASEFASVVWAIGSMETPAVDFFQALELRKDLESHHLSQLCWALGSAGVRRPQLMKALATELLTRHDLSLQSVANVWWAFRSLELLEEPLELHLQSLVAQHLLRVTVEDVESLLGILWASEDEALRAAVNSCLQRLGRQMDKLREPFEVPEELRVVYELPGILVLFKPAGWEVDTMSSSSSNEKSIRFLLKAEGKGFSGFISRLDAPSSGLLLLATSFQSLFWLQAQREMRLLERDYVALCRGWLKEEEQELRWRLRRQGRSVIISQHGRKALTKAQLFDMSM